jgi:hypothetical protein
MSRVIERRLAKLEANNPTGRLEDMSADQLRIHVQRLTDEIVADYESVETCRAWLESFLNTMPDGSRESARRHMEAAIDRRWTSQRDVGRIVRQA